MGTLEQRAEEYLQTLSNVRPNRRTGSEGNREATAFFAEKVRQFGFAVDSAPFECLDYEGGPSSLSSPSTSFAVYTGPYSLPCDTTAPLVLVTTVEQLAQCDCRDRILLLKGPICSEQLMPKNFVFYNPERHQRIYALLEEKKPAGLIAATGSSPEQVGALYPFPLITDGDFDIPNAYCTDALGDEIAAAATRPFRLHVQGKRIPSTANNVVARRNPGAPRKIVATAHIDAYENSPGASDNASGTVVLLLLAELLGDYTGTLMIEIAALNGEDHYSAGGQMDYLKRYGSELGNVFVAINIDDVGYRIGTSSYSTYECTNEIEETVRSVFHTYGGLEEGEQWHSGDHMIFVQAGRPAIAITSSEMAELMRTITHTERDTPEIIDPARLIEVARALNDFVRRQHP